MCSTSQSNQCALQGSCAPRPAPLMSGESICEERHKEAASVQSEKKLYATAETLLLAELVLTSEVSKTTFSKPFQYSNQWSHSRCIRCHELKATILLLKLRRDVIFQTSFPLCGVGKNYCSLTKVMVDNLLVIGWAGLFLVQWGNLIAILKITNETVCKIKLQLTVQRLPLTFTSIANDFFPHLPSAWSFFLIGNCNERKWRKVQGFLFLEAFFSAMKWQWQEVTWNTDCFVLVLLKHCDPRCLITVLVQLMDLWALINYKPNCHF